MSVRGRTAAVAIFKPKAWHPVAKHGSTKQEEIPITKNERYAASSRPAIFRYGTTKRIVKDCRVGRTRPPRNDKTGRFCIRRKKRLTFGGENGRPREPRNKSAAARSGSFVPTDRFENLEIHRVFLQFPNLNLEQNPSLTALAIESEVPLHFSARFAIIFPNRAKRESEVIS